MNTFRINKIGKNDMVKFKDTDDFEAKIGEYNNENYILKFSASWCKPCQILQTQLDSLSPYLKDRNIHVLHADVDKCKILAQNFDIGPIPTFFFYRPSHRQVAKFVGIPTNLSEEIQRYYGDIPVKNPQAFYSNNPFLAG